jgi:hypothetical protein
MLVAHACKEAAIRRIVVQSQPRQRVKGTPRQKEKKSHKRVVGMTQSVGTDFKHQCHKKKDVEV